MANAVLTKLDAPVAFTITLASLANVSSRQSDIVTNSLFRPAAMIYLKIKSGSLAPNPNGIYTVHLIRANKSATPEYRSDGAGASDAAITLENAKCLGVITCTAHADKDFYGEFDTNPLGPLGPAWGIIVRNASGQALSSTPGDFYVGYSTYYPEFQ